MGKPLISVLIPVYNSENYLPRCIDSIRAQTYTNLEIIVVNDGSTDSSGQICESYARKDNRIKVIHQKNQGVAATRNTALHAASGEYLTFVDSDDYIHPTTIEEMHLRMYQDRSDMVIVKHLNVDDFGIEDGSFCAWMKDGIWSSEEYFEQMGKKDIFWPGLWGKLIQRKLMRGIEVPDLICGEDMGVVLQIVEKCSRISVLERTLYYYYQRSDSITHEMTEDRRRDDLKAIVNVICFFLDRNYISAARRYYRLAIERAFAMKDRRSGLKIIQESVGFSVRRILFSHQGIIIRVKWISLGAPVVYWMYIKLKQVKTTLCRLLYKNLA